MIDTLENTTTKTEDQLKQQVRSASNHARQLALELDAAPAKVEQGIKQDVKRRARAARNGDDMAAVDAESDVAGLRQRQKDLPLKIWAAKVHHASLEVELFSRQQKDNEEKAKLEKVGLPGLRLDMEKATRAFNEKARAVRGFVGGADRLSSARAEAEKRLTQLEQEYPGV